MPATPLIILLSVGTFQALLPAQGPQATATFDDNAQGARAFVTWAKATMPTPGFAQPPLRICVVGAVPFTPEAAPYLPRPLWESTMPLRALEPYSATFHYVEDAAAPAGKAGSAPKAATTAKAAKPPKPRTMQQAQKICAEAARQPQPTLVIPPLPAASRPAGR